MTKYRATYRVNSNLPPLSYSNKQPKLNSKMSRIQ